MDGYIQTGGNPNVDYGTNKMFHQIMKDSDEFIRKVKMGKVKELISQAVEYPITPAPKAWYHGLVPLLIAIPNIREFIERYRELTSYGAAQRQVHLSILDVPKDSWSFIDTAELYKTLTNIYETINDNFDSR